MEIVHMFVNLFAGGRSEVKIYLFFLYLAILSALFFLHKNKRIGFKKPSYATTLQALYISLSCLFITGIWTHIYLVKSLGLNISDFFITFRNGEISSSVLEHIHTLKGSMAVILSVFNKGVFEGVDAGLAFLGIFPTYIFICCIVLLGIAFSGFLFLYKHTLDRIPESRTYIYLFTFAILSFSILKNTIDGGLFNSESIPSILFLYILIVGYTQKIGLRIYLLMVMLLYIIIILTNVYSFSPYIIDLIGISSLYILLTYFAVFNEKNIYVTCIVILFSLFGMYIGTEKDRTLFAYIHTVIPAQSNIYIQAKKDILPDIETTKEYLGSMIFYTGTTTKKMQIKDILSKTRVPTNFQSVSVDNITCEASRKNTIHYYLILKKPLNIDQEFLIRNHTSSFIKVIDLQKVSTYEDTNYIKYKITLQRNSCVKRWVEILQEFFEYYGIQEFFIKEFRY